MNFNIKKSRNLNKPDDWKGQYRINAVKGVIKIFTQYFQKFVYEGILFVQFLVNEFNTLNKEKFYITRSKDSNRKNL